MAIPVIYLLQFIDIHQGNGNNSVFLPARFHPLRQHFPSGPAVMDSCQVIEPGTPGQKCIFCNVGKFTHIVALPVPLCPIVIMPVYPPRLCILLIPDNRRASRFPVFSAAERAFSRHSFLQKLPARLSLRVLQTELPFHGVIHINNCFRLRIQNIYIRLQPVENFCKKKRIKIINSSRIHKSSLCYDTVYTISL